MQRVDQRAVSSRAPGDPPEFSPPLSRRLRHGSVALVAALTAMLGPLVPLEPAEYAYIQPGSSWRVLPGLAEASTPDTTAWRGVDFDDSSWLEGSAPVGYGTPSLGVDLGALDPPMRGNYTSVYLRREFVVGDPAGVTQLLARLRYDDGFLLFINGQIAARANVSGAGAAMGQLSHFPLDGSLLDTEAASNHGTFLGGGEPTYVEGFDGTPGGAMSFDGQDDVVLLDQNSGLPLHDNPAYTVAMWVRGVAGGDNADDRVFSESRSNTSSGNPLLNLGTDNTGSTGAVDVYIRNPDGSVPINHGKSQGIAFDGSWHHIAWVDDSGSAVLYIDGLRDPADFNYSRDSMGFDVTAIGGIWRGSSCCLFTGDIDDVRLFDRALSAEEIGDLLEGAPVTFDGVANGPHAADPPQTHEIANPASILVRGINTAAVQLFNASIDDADLFFDLELVDPFGPSVAEPLVLALAPPAASTVRSFTSVEVTFDQAVAGVEATDLLVDGVPAIDVSGSDAGPYLFSFPEPAPGQIGLQWAAGHGIVASVEPFLAFGGGSWTVTLDPDAPEADVVINEILAANRNGLVDDFGEKSDWIELLHRGSGPVNITGWSLTDERDDDDKWVIGNVQLDPGEYLVIVASGQDVAELTGGTYLHTNFQLNSSGDYLALYNGESPRRLVAEFSPEYPPQRADVSWGLDATGKLVYFATPTPGAPNSGASIVDGFVFPPEFSVAHGLFTDPFDLELSTATPQAAIRYTLDGSDPAGPGATVYNGAFEIDPLADRGAVVVRAMATRDGFLPSTEAVSTYIFPERVVTQSSSPSGFPSSWGGAAADYGMDPEIVQSALYRDRLVEGLVSIPTVSLVFDVDDVFSSSTGIYSNSEREGVSWERPTSAEFIMTDPEDVRDDFQVHCGLRIQGGASRIPSRSPKHSFRLLFKGAYGPTRLRRRVFPDSPLENFDTITLRAGYNNSWIHSSSGQRNACQYIRDQWCRDIQLAMGQPSSHGTYAHLFLNGLYWGLYNVVERPSAPFLASYLGGKKEEYDALNSGNVVDGNRTAWNQMMTIANAGLASNTAYTVIQDYLDIPGLIDYMIMNLYGANGDWPHHNWYAGRRRMPGAQYRFISWDAERTLEGLSANQTGVSNNDTPARLYDELRANAEFRLLFADHVHRHLFNDGVLAPERAREVFEARSQEIDSAVILESARWGDYRRSEPYTRNAEWLAEQSRLFGSYFPGRTNVVVGQFRSIGLYPPVGAPIFNRHGGVIEPGFELTMTRPGGTNGTIYYTLDGVDPRVPVSGAIAGSAAAYTSPLTINDLTRVRARIREGSQWSALAEATFRRDPGLDSLHFTEIMYHPLGGSFFEFIELTNTGVTTLDLGGMYFSDGITYEFAPYTLLRPGEIIVLVADAGAFEGLYPGVDFHGVFLGSLDNAGERITLSRPGGEVVVSARYDEEGFWPLGPDGFGFSLVLADPEGDPDAASTWRTSAVKHGSPGEADPAVPPVGLVVNEVLARASAPLEGAIELHNTGSTAVSLANWFLGDSRLDAADLLRYALPAPIDLPPGGHHVIYAVDFNGPAGLSLAAGGGTLYLSESDGNGELAGHVAAFRYRGVESGLSVGRISTSVGPDIAPLIRPTFGIDNPATVDEFRQGGGAENSGPRVGPLVLNEIMYHPLEGGIEFVEIHNISAEPVDLHDDGRGLGWRLDGLSGPGGLGDFELTQGSVPAGGFAVVVGRDPDVFRSIHDIPPGVAVLGPFLGALDNDGERLRLLRPGDAVDGAVVFELVDELRFNDAVPWPEAADGEGPSLERIQATFYANDPINWAASRFTGGTPGRRNSVSDEVPNLPPVASFTVEYDPASRAPLEVLLDASASRDTDGSIVTYLWNLGDGTAGIGRTFQHTYEEPGEFRIRLTVRDDDDATDQASFLITVNPHLDILVRPGDFNADALVDISDIIGLLFHLFLGETGPLPCEGSLQNEMGNRPLLDANGDLGVDISDAIWLLEHQFLGGPPHVLGTGCIVLEGCTPTCLLR